MESLKIFTQEFSNDDHGLTVRFLWQGHFAFCAFICEVFMDCAEDFCANVNKTVKCVST